MAGKTTLDHELLREDDIQKPATEDKDRKREIIYWVVPALLYVHLAALYGLYLMLTKAKWTTAMFGFLVSVLSGIGTTAGAHRLWAHRAYKAKRPLQILLMVLFTLTYQRSLFKWIKIHRIHHKFTDTDADPHNANRGFFFSHIGWLILRKHPENSLKGKTIDMSDIYSNPVLKFQDKYAIVLTPLLCFILPTLVPVYIWNEDLFTSWHITIFRYVVTLHIIFLVNSAAHLWGNKPYDRFIKPVDNKLISFMAFGEGFHNYHHTFPWDYRTAELGNNYLNLSTKFIDFFAWIGWAYDLRTVSEDLVKSRIQRTGEGCEF